MTKTDAQDGSTIEGLLDGLTALDCEWESVGFDKWKGRCPTCSGYCLTIRHGEAGGFELECPCRDCTPDGIVEAVFTPPPSPVQLAVDTPDSGRSAFFSTESLESECLGNLESRGCHETLDAPRTLGLPLEAISRAIRESIPKEPNRRTMKPLGVNKVAWLFARHLKSIPELRSLEMPRLLEVLETASADLHKTASELFQNPQLLPEKGRLMEEVIVCFGDAKTGVDESRLYVATTQARSAPYTDSKLTSPQQVIAAVCRNLSRFGDGEFFLSEQCAAAAANVAKRSGTAALRKLVMLHLIEVIRKGTNDKGVKGERPKRQATLYRWIGPL